VWLISHTRACLGGPDESRGARTRSRVQHQTKSPIPGYGTTRRLLKAYALFDVLCGRALGTEKTNFAGGKEAGRLLGIRAYSIHPTFLRRRLRKDLGFCRPLSAEWANHCLFNRNPT
jgi:hypothetical protein